MQHHQSKARLLDATIKVVRTKGYTATHIEDVCAEAGVTKGSFFHHFKSKDDLALAALDRWKSFSGEIFAHAGYHSLPDPLDRVLGYIDFRKSILTGGLAEFTCFAGTILQEMYATNPRIRAGCESSICGHAAILAADIEAAMQLYPVAGEIAAESLALHTQCVIQGAFILAKAKGSAAVAAGSIDHLRRYILLLFGMAEGPGIRSDLKIRHSTRHAGQQGNHTDAREGRPA